MSTQRVGVRDIFKANGSAPVEYRRVYVWELPVRAYHWINAIALTLLCVTGFLIGHPVRLGTPGSLPAILVRLGSIHPLRGRIHLRVQLCRAHLLGICREQVREVE